MVYFALSVTIIKGYYPALVSAPILSKFVRANSIKMPPKYKLVLLIALVLVATSLAGRTKEHPKHPPSLQEQQHTTSSCTWCRGGTNLHSSKEGTKKASELMSESKVSDCLKWFNFDSISTTTTSRYVVTIIIAIWNLGLAKTILI